MMKRLEKIRNQVQIQDLNPDAGTIEFKIEEGDELGFDSDISKKMVIEKMEPTQRFLYDNELLILYPAINENNLTISNIRAALETGAEELEISHEILKTYGIIPSNFQAYFN